MSTLFVVPSFSKKKTQNPNFCWFLVLREKSPTWVAICRVPLWASWRTNTSSAVASHLKAARKTGRFSLFGNPLEKKNGGFYEVKKLRQKMGNSLKIPIGTDFFPALATKSEYIAARNKWLRRNTVCVSFWEDCLFSPSSCSGSVSKKSKCPPEFCSESY